jgi:hypothetical protein
LVVELIEELDRELEDTELDRELEVELDELDLELESKLDDDCDELDLELEILDVELEFDELDDDIELDCVLDDLLLVELVDELDFDVDWLDDCDELTGLFSELEVTTMATEDCELLLEETLEILIEEELTTVFRLEVELETAVSEDDVALFAIWLELFGLELFNCELDELLFPSVSPPPQAANARESIKQVAILYPIIIKSQLLIMIWNFTSNSRFSMRRISHW